MGLVMRDGLNRLTHVKKYSRFYQTICANVGRIGFAIGTGKIAGVDPREMALSDLVVIWGTNPVNTQVNVMTHAARARKERGAKIAAVDIYDNETMKQADIKIILRPGTDGAFACGVMHVLFRDGYADRAYMDKYTDCPDELEAHLKTRTPEWASAICGVPVSEIEAFAKLVGETKRTFFRLGYGFTRSRNGATQMHAALCVPAVTGAWQYEGGGAFFNNFALWHFNKSLIEGHDAIDQTTARSTSRRIGRILTGDAEALLGKGPIKAMLIQNTNPMTVAPEQALVRQGFAREDLFVAVHEQFMTETAEMADIVLPATMFMEHDDLYYGGGHQHISVGPKLIDPPGECRSNHQVHAGAGAAAWRRSIPGFEMTPRELIDATLKLSDHGDIAGLEADLWRDLHRTSDLALSRRLCPCRQEIPFQGRLGASAVRQERHGTSDKMPSLPDHWAAIEHTDQAPSVPARNLVPRAASSTPPSTRRRPRRRARARRA